VDMIVRAPCLERVRPRRNYVTEIIWMSRVVVTPVVQFFQSLSEVVYMLLVGELDFAFGCPRAYVSFDAVDKQTKRLFTRAQCPR